MPMRLFVPSHGKLRHVSNESATANLNNGRPIPTAALFAFFQAQVMNISDEVDVPDLLSVIRTLSFEIILLAVKTIAKHVRAVKDKFLVVQKVHHERR